MIEWCEMIDRGKWPEEWKNMTWYQGVPLDEFYDIGEQNGEFIDDTYPN